MTDLLLYTLIVPNASQDRLSNQQRQQLARAGVLDGDVGVAEPIASDPSDRTLNGVYRGEYAEKMAAELDELASSSGIDTVPLAGVDAETSLDGYYTVEDARIEPAQAQTGRAQTFELSLAKRGRRASHYRAVESNPREVEHEFGNALDRLVGVPAAARKVQWFDVDGGARASADPLETRQAELGDVDIYDLDAAPAEIETDRPALVYTIDYDLEERVDCRIYDTEGRSSKHDVDGNLQWRKVFTTDHDPAGEFVLDNGILRLRLDENAGLLEAEEWDDTAESWTTVGLETDQPSTVELFDADVATVGMVRDLVQLTFDVDGSLFSLDAIVHCGHDIVQFGVPENEDPPIPTDLEDWLAPIASESLVDPNASKTLVSRKEVRR